MANQQLVDYVKGQMMAGVSEPDIRKILKDAGWPDADVEEGIKGAKPASSPAPVAVSAVSAPASTTAPATSFSIASLTGQSAKSAEPAKTEPKTEPKKGAMSFDFMSNPAGMSTMGSVASGAKDSGKAAAAAQASIVGGGSAGSSGGRLPWIIAGVAILVLVGSGVYFLNKVGTLSDLSNQLTAANSTLTSQIADLRNTGAAGDSELTAAKAKAKEAIDELALFMVPQNASGTPAATPFTLKGLVGQSSKGIYTLSTQNGILLSVKNSKDIKLDFSLKPLVGATAELAGTHVPGTYEITVQTINGFELQSPAISTPAQSTSTATSTKFGGPKVGPPGSTSTQLTP